MSRATTGSVFRQIIASLRCCICERKNGGCAVSFAVYCKSKCVLIGLHRMELSRPPPPAPVDASDSEGLLGSLDAIAAPAVSAEDWATHLAYLAPKLMCLTGTHVYKFSRDRILKKQWQNPSLKTLQAVGKGCITWTGSKPVRCISACIGPSHALESLM